MKMILDIINNFKLNGKTVTIVDECDAMMDLYPDFSEYEVDPDFVFVNVENKDKIVKFVKSIESEALDVENQGDPFIVQVTIDFKDEVLEEFPNLLELIKNSDFCKDTIEEIEINECLFNDEIEDYDEGEEITVIQEISVNTYLDK